MKKILTISLMAVVASSALCWGQVGGNSVYGQASGRARAEQMERNKRVLAKEDLPPTGTSTFVEANVLINVKADAYVAVFAMTHEGETLAECSFQNGASFAVDLLGTTAGTEYDRLVVNGTVNLGSSNLQLNLGFQSNGGDKFFILVNDGTDAISGTFAGLPQDATITIGDQAFGISYTGDLDTGSLTSGNDVVLFTVGVPEPSTLALCCLVGVGAVGTWYWRKRSRTRA